MNDWQDDIAKSLDEIDETRREMQQLQLHNAEVVKQKAPSRWRELSAAVEREVKRWSDKFQGRNERAVEFVRLSDTHFAVRKLYFPQVRLDVEFRLEAEVINYQYTRHESANSSAGSGGLLSLEFLVGTDNEVYLVRERKAESIQDASQWLLMPVFKACQ